MKKFEYLPELVVAYNNADKSGELISINCANASDTYYCPCCGDVVEIAKAGNQKYFRHKSGNNSKREQVEMYCSEWLLKPGGNFKVDGKTYTVETIEINKSYPTLFGEYVPDVTVTTTDKNIMLFELTFGGVKQKKELFCKWLNLNIQVVAIDNDSYFSKNTESDIPEFSSLFKDGQCLNKSFVANDGYYKYIYPTIKSIVSLDLDGKKFMIETINTIWSGIQSKNYDLVLSAIDNDYVSIDDAIYCARVINNIPHINSLRRKVIDNVNNRVIELIKNSLLLDSSKIEFGFQNYSRSTKDYKIGAILKYHTKNIDVTLIGNNSINYSTPDGIFDYSEIISQIEDWSNSNLDDSIQYLTRIQSELDSADKYIESLEEKLRCHISNNKITIVVKDWNGNWIPSDTTTHTYRFKDIQKIINSAMGCVDDEMSDSEHDELLYNIHHLDELNYFTDYDIGIDTSYCSHRVYINLFRDSKVFFEINNYVIDDIIKFLDDQIANLNRVTDLVTKINHSGSWRISFNQKLNYVVVRISLTGEEYFKQDLLYYTESDNMWKSIITSMMSELVDKYTYGFKGCRILEVA